MDNIDRPTVYVVDGVSETREALQELLESVGLAVSTHPDTEDFLAHYVPGKPGCLILDLGKSSTQGLREQQKLNRHGIDLPMIILGGDGEVATAVAAMKNGALDFIEKPYNEQILLDSIQKALARDRERRQMLLQRRAIFERFAALTPREQEVMKHVVQGAANKAIAKKLSVSRKTVEVHRAKIMDKMQAVSFAHLIQMALILGILEDYAEQEELAPAPYPLSPPQR